MAGLPDRLCNHRFATAYLFDCYAELELNDVERGHLDQVDVEYQPKVSHTLKVEKDGTASSLFLDYIFRPAGSTTSTCMTS